jgi:hypothetical protein
MVPSLIGLLPPVVASQSVPFVLLAQHILSVAFVRARRARCCFAMAQGLRGKVHTQPLTPEHRIVVVWLVVPVVVCDVRLRGLWWPICDNGCWCDGACGCWFGRIAAEDTEKQNTLRPKLAAAAAGIGRTAEALDLYVVLPVYIWH